MSLMIVPLRPRPESSRYVPWLGALFGLFACRVIAQLTQKYYPVDFLPPFQAWQGSSLPYRWLLLSQLVVLGVEWWTIRCFITGSIQPSKHRGRILIVGGGVYFVSMALRLVLGLTIYADTPWFGATIPAFFHLVLASFVLVVGYFHIVNSPEI